MPTSYPSPWNHGAERGSPPGGTSCEPGCVPRSSDEGDAEAGHHSVRDSVNPSRLVPIGSPHQALRLARDSWPYCPAIHPVYRLGRLRRCAMTGMASQNEGITYRNSIDRISACTPSICRLALTRDGSFASRATHPILSRALESRPSCSLRSARRGSPGVTRRPSRDLARCMLASVSRSWARCNPACNWSSSTRRRTSSAVGLSPAPPVAQRPASCARAVARPRS